MSIDRDAWVARVPAARAIAVASLRRAGAIEVAVEGAEIWLSGDALDGELEARLRRIPDLTIHRRLPDGRLVAHGRRIPSGRAPESGWRPLDAWAVPGDLEPSPPGAVGARVSLQLVRSGEEEVAGALLATALDFRRWAADASAARLAALVFAAGPDGRVLVRGRPLPPIPGARCVDSGGIVVPAGWTFRPRVPPAVVRERLDLGPGDAALFDPSGTWERIPADGFVRATRSAVRATFGPDPVARHA